MKKTYKTPTMTIVKIQTQHQMLAGSSYSVGSPYSGETVLSRDGGADWDDDY